jgi:YesN/AraC family two-component response regulator
MKASRLRKPFVYRCHAGLTEAVAPVYMGNLPVAYLMFGHLASYPSTKDAQLQVVSCCRQYDLDDQKLEGFLNNMPLTDEQTILAASRILMAVTSWLCLDQMVTLKRHELPVQLDEYISANLQNDLSTETLCSHFNIGKTKLYKLSKEYYGESIADHIRSLRIYLAKKLLSEEKDLSINEIATRCGFSDYNYFITVFKKHCGVSPAKFRKTDNL